ncbi:hypothetical protein D0863_11763 [Hortaea werneckii]|uniref:Uncharacterized protein n=1 Tax=Hortaea werneckii TaxID=91943 RepID=A0A3M7D6K5_HORWE|nr:hypothetical protein D0863_11763 [Hortaea werneckii]
MDYYTNALPSPPTRTLRSILPVVWPIGFALLLAHGATQAVLLPALGIIPMTLSSLTRLIHYRGILDDFRLTTLFLDFFCAAFLFALLMPSWLVIARDYGYYYGAGTIMLATYGTVPLMVQLYVSLPPRVHLQFPLYPFLCTPQPSSIPPSLLFHSLPSSPNPAFPTTTSLTHLQTKRTIHLRFLLDRSSWQNLFPASTCPHCHHHLPTLTPRRFGNSFFTRNRGARFGEYQDLPTGGDDETSIPGSGKQPQQQQQQQQETGSVFLEDKERQQEEIDRRKRSSTSSYSSAGEGMPRPSTDDETARLV